MNYIMKIENYCIDGGMIADVWKRRRKIHDRESEVSDGYITYYVGYNKINLNDSVTPTNLVLHWHEYATAAGTI